MLFNTLSLLAVLPAYVLALPMPHSNVPRRSHRFIKTSSKSTRAASSVHTADMISALFPAGQGDASWSTAPGIPGAIKLADEAFNATATMDKAKPAYDTAPDGSHSMKVHFNKGAYDYKGPQGGLSFYARPMDFSDALEATFTYSLFFQEGFDFNKGGKLPGMYGGDDPQTAISCSGGRRDVTCWSTRLMFRTNGDAEVYAYLPQPDADPKFSGNKQLCNVTPLSVCNDEFGASVGRGSWKWPTGRWITVTQRNKLNSAGQQDGELELIADGKSVINIKGLAFRDNSKGKFQGIQMQSFFGGHTSDWASPQDQDVYFSNFTMAITQKLSGAR